jgi:hypothetical protein
MLEISSAILLSVAPPLATGAYPEQCGAALPGWESPLSNAQRVENRLRLKANGTLEWNGTRVSEGNVAEYAKLLTELQPQPFTILEIEKGASCERASAIRNLIEQQVKCRASTLCGETGIPPSK